jgi:preprotein translocase subunit YajC
MSGNEIALTTVIVIAVFALSFAFVLIRRDSREKL